MCALLKTTVNTVLKHLTLPIHCSKKLKHLTLRPVNFIPNAMTTMLFKHMAFLYLPPNNSLSGPWDGIGANLNRIRLFPASPLLPFKNQMELKKILMFQSTKK